MSHKNTLYNHQSEFIFCLSLLILTSLFLSSSALAGRDKSRTSLTIDAARYDSGNLFVSGSHAERRSVVTVTNPNIPEQFWTTVSSRKGKWSLQEELPELVPCTIKASNGEKSSSIVEVSGAPADCDLDGGGGPVFPPIGGDSITSTSANTNNPPDKVTEQPIDLNDNYKVLAANDLGMHCADLDFQVFSILPPFNVVHAQVIERGRGNLLPRLLDDTEVDVFYSAASNENDPAATGDSILPVYKSNFWSDPDGDGKTLGFEGYAPLYYGLLKPTDINTLDVGLPVFDSALLRACLQPYLDGEATADETREACKAVQQNMPGVDAPYQENRPQKFARFDKEVNFFNELFGGKKPGGIIHDANWFAADGIPIKPVDDQGRENAYPLLRIQAYDKGTELAVASTDVVTPVASEADCQTCHADQSICDSIGESCDGKAASLADTSFDVIDDINDERIPGNTPREKVLNAAKLNILALHDAKHETQLTQQTPVQCATCHYTPALDLAQLGPVTPAQKSNISMSRAMHGHHGSLSSGSGLVFPDMPPPDDPRRDDGIAGVNGFEQDILEQTCYQCHPGKRTQCLRGAMATGGVVCQDCHGQARHVGNDFTEGLAQSETFNPNTYKRIPWAQEPGCQSCHTGDALNPNHPADGIVAEDGIRLLQAFTLREGRDHDGNGDGTEVAAPYQSPNSRFAENESLYRLSKGHGGLMCEGCHGSTHAIYPNPNPNANDNVASVQLQGHRGTITECDTCHDQSTFEDSGDLQFTMDGPHGMHSVGSYRWNKEHEEAMVNDGQNCRTCHGRNGEGTVLSRMAKDRILRCKDEKGLVCRNEGDQLFEKGHQVGCADCHENEL
jgi:hypothetical protein